MSDDTARIAPTFREMADELEHLEKHGCEDAIKRKLAEIDGAIDGARQLVGSKRREVQPATEQSGGNS